MTTSPTDPPNTRDETSEQDDAIIGVAFKWSLVVIVAIGAIVGGIMLMGGEEEQAPDIIDRDKVDGPGTLVQEADDRRDVAFTDVTADAGIDFVHVSGARGGKLLPETMGGGCAFFDVDGDGDQDLLFVNSNWWPGEDDGDTPTMRLYRNDGSGQFEDATADWGLDRTLYGMGVACGDYDGDGRVDLYVTALGENLLLRNTGERFEDTTQAMSVAGAADEWSTSAGFFDYDVDGDLDLFVCNYVYWTKAIDVELNYTLNGSDRAYGPPVLYAGRHSVLYRNDGGTFTDVSDEAGIERVNQTGGAMGKALAVTFVDLQMDGLPDIVVANDTVQNFVFLNRGDGGFDEIGSMTGIAFDNRGDATGAMGIDAADYANDGGLGIGIGNFANETTSFYVQQPNQPLQFADMSDSEGIGSPSRLKLSFGLLFFDYDLDGRLDLLQANGHLEDEINQIQSSQHYRQPAQLFWNCGPGGRACFAMVPEDVVGDLTRPIVGRGAAYADIDGDGDVDVLLTQTGGAPLLLRNDQSLDRHWLRVALRGPAGNRDAIGAWVEVVAGEITQRRQVMPTRSYLSQVELPVTFGLGDDDAIDSMRIVWPDGTTQDVDVDGVDHVITVEYEAVG